MRTQISTYQTALLLIITVLGTAVLLLPQLVIEEAKQDAWLGGILLFSFSMAVSLIYILLIGKMKRKDLINFTRQLWGSVLALPTTIGLIVYFIMLGGLVTREVSELLIGVYLPNTPLWFFNSTIVLTAAVFVYYGLEVMARTLEIVFYLFLFAFLGVVLILIEDMSLSFLQPVLGNGWQPIAKGVAPGLLFFSELFVVLIFAPQMKDEAEANKALLWAAVVISSVFLIVIFTVLMIFGVDLASNLTFPLLSAHRYAETFGVIERLDPFFILYWVGGGILKVAIFFYGAVYCGQKLFKASNYYWLIPVVGSIIYFLSIYYFNNLSELMGVIDQSLPYFLSVQVLYPSLLLVTSWWRDKKLEQKS